MILAVDLAGLDLIVKNDFAVPAERTAEDFLPGLLVNLGSTDSDLRETSLDVLWTWLEKRVFIDAVIRQIAVQMDQNLHSGLGEKENDTVFLRAFSALILGMVIRIDRQSREKGEVKLIEDDQINKWLTSSLTLLVEENDLRGFVEGKGWAHCLAHTGDLLAELSIHPAINKNSLEEILDALYVRFTKPVDHILVHNEDERLAAVVITILQREVVSLEFYSNWLKKFIEVPGGLSWKEAFTHPTANSARVNSKAFLRGIYFFLVFGFKNDPVYKKTDSGEKLKQMLLLTLKQIHPSGRYGDELE